MKTKLIILFTAIILATTVLYKTRSADNFDYSKKIGINSISCTTAKFLLKNIDTTKQIAPLFENLGNHTYIVSTKNKLAQQFFNQGLRLTYAFNHAEAHRSFMEASRLDPKCAMAYWGQAYVLGPNINDPAPDDERKNKYNEAIKRVVDQCPVKQHLLNPPTFNVITNMDKEVLV